MALGNFDILLDILIFLLRGLSQSGMTPDRPLTAILVCQGTDQRMGFSYEILETIADEDDCRKRQRTLSLSANARTAMKHHPLTLASLLLLALFQTSCSKRQDAISIGINAWPGYEYIYLAEAKGFYEKHGVNVKIVEFNSLADARQAYERSHLSGLACTIVEHCQILDNCDREPRISLIADYSNGGDVIIADEEISSIADLKGRRIGLEIGSLGIYILARVLEKAGLDFDDVKAVGSDQLNLVNQIAAGDIDVAITYPPHSVNMLREGALGQIFSTADIPNEVLDILIFDQTFLSQREAEARAVIEAIYEAQEWAASNKDEAYGIMAAREGISPEEFKTIIEEDIVIVGRSQQADFFEQPEALISTLRKCDSILRKTGQVVNSSRLEGSVAADIYKGVL